MKRILILLAFCTSILNAQSPVFDTAYVISKNSKFYLLNRIEYDDDSYYEKVTIIGDTAQFYLSALQKFESTANSYANFVNGSYFYGKETTGAIRENAGIIAITGKSPIDTLGVQTFEFLSDNKFRWVINQSGTSTPITFSVAANKTLRYVLDGNLSRLMYGFGKNMIRLTNFQTVGVFLDLYWDEGRKLYVSQDGKINLRRISATR
jgi:hypothetical protein